MYYYYHYVIDWDKVKTLDDMKRILEALQITFEPDCSGIDKILDLVNLEPKQHHG